MAIFNVPRAGRQNENYTENLIVKPHTIPGDFRRLF